MGTLEIVVLCAAAFAAGWGVGLVLCPDHEATVDELDDAFCAGWRAGRRASTEEDQS